MTKSRRRIIEAFSVVAIAVGACSAGCSEDEPPPVPAGGRSGSGGASGAGSGGSAGIGGAAGTSGAAGTNGAAGTSGAAGSGAVDGSGGTSDGGGSGGAPTDSGADGDAADATVRGRVVDDVGAAASGVTIVIGSKSVVTGNAGAFEISDVPSTYDLTALDGAGSPIEIYRGLTRRDPTIRRLAATASRANLSGTLSGGTAFPLATSVAARVAFSTPSGGAGSVLLEQGDGPAYGPLEALFGGGPSKAGFVCALAYQRNAGGEPVQYEGWGCSNVTVTGSVPQTGVNIALGAVQNGSAGGTVTLPSGYAPTRYVLDVYRGDAVLPISLFNDNTAVGSTFSYPVPGGPSDLLIGVRVESENSAAFESAFAQVVTAPRTDISLSVSSAPALGLPINAATGVGLTTSFSWGASDAGIYRARFEAPSASRSIYVITSQTSITLPDLSSIGAALPANTAFFWGVQAGPATSVDEAASALGRPARQWRSAVSRQRTFTTAP